MALPKYTKRIYAGWFILLFLIVLEMIAIYQNGHPPLKGTLLILVIATILFVAPPVTVFMQITPEEFKPHGVKLAATMFGSASVIIVTIFYLLINPTALPRIEGKIGFPLFSIIFFVGFGLFTCALLFMALEQINGKEKYLPMYLLAWLIFVSSLVSLLSGAYLFFSTNTRSIAIALPVLMWLPMLIYLRKFQSMMLEMMNMVRPSRTNNPRHPAVIFARGVDRK